MNIERPLDFLEGKKGKEVLIKTQNENNLIKAKLVAFDIHINLVVEIKSSPRFIKGYEVLWIE